MSVFSTAQVTNIEWMGDFEWWNRICSKVVKV